MSEIVECVVWRKGNGSVRETEHNQPCLNPSVWSSLDLTFKICLEMQTKPRSRRPPQLHATAARHRSEGTCAAMRPTAGNHFQHVIRSVFNICTSLTLKGVCRAPAVD